MREAIIRGTPDRDDDGQGRRGAATEAAPPRSPSTRTRSSGPSGSRRSSGSGESPSAWRSAWRPRRKRGEPLPHILFDGPPGLGKTTFATVLHNELGVELNITSGAALDKKMDVMPYLTNAAEGSILFIDEIHRLPSTVEEFIYPVMEDFRVDVVLGRGDVGPDDQPAAEEVHDHRRHHPQRHALRSAPRAVRHPRAPGILRGRGPGDDRHDQRRQAPHDDRARGGLGAGRTQPRDAADRQRPAAVGPRLLAGPRRRAHQPVDRPGRARHAGGRRRGPRQAGPPLPRDPDPGLRRRPDRASRRSRPP